MAQFGERFGSDLADAFVGCGERLAHFFQQSVLAAVFEAEGNLMIFILAPGMERSAPKKPQAPRAIQGYKMGTNRRLHLQF
jgi:hypothetical protein